MHGHGVKFHFDGHDFFQVKITSATQRSQMLQTIVKINIVPRKKCETKRALTDNHIKLKYKQKTKQKKKNVNLRLCHRVVNLLTSQLFRSFASSSCKLLPITVILLSRRFSFMKQSRLFLRI